MKDQEHTSVMLSTVIVCPKLIGNKFAIWHVNIAHISKLATFGFQFRISDQISNQ